MIQNAAGLAFAIVSFYKKLQQSQKGQYLFNRQAATADLFAAVRIDPLPIAARLFLC